MEITDKKSREKIVIKTSLIGIGANILLASFKAVVGALTNSIAIILDAVNNFSDVLSSLITIIGAKLAAKEPDKEHPYGHGRVEYLSAMIIAGIILYAGIASLFTSIDKILNPQLPEYTIASFIIVIVATIVKIVLGLYVKKMGKIANSDSLIGSGKDALSDAVISSSTLMAALIFTFSKISLEAYLGVVISFLIMKTGYDMLKNTLSQILGERVDNEISNSIKATVNSFDEVYGSYDLILNNYGPDTYLGSIHIEVQDTMTAGEIDELTRKITHKVFKKHGVILTAVGIYSYNTNDTEAMDIREKIGSVISEYKSVLQMHGFYYNKKENAISFDIIFDFDDKNKDETYNQIFNKVSKMYPNSRLNIIVDNDVSD